jgi:hypothetical protein
MVIRETIPAATQKDHFRSAIGVSRSARNDDGVVPLSANDDRVACTASIATIGRRCAIVSAAGFGCRVAARSDLTRLPSYSKVRSTNSSSDQKLKFAAA